MRIIAEPMAGLVVLEPTVYADARGAFFEAFNARTFRTLAGTEVGFVQDNQSISHKGVRRGLHYQVAPHAQGKLVRVVAGCIFDVAVDIREESSTFGQWFGLELSARNRRQLWIPEGFAHGFLALEDASEVFYKATDFWHGPSERSIHPDDPELRIEWPDIGFVIQSDKDRDAPWFRDAFA